VSKSLFQQVEENVLLRNQSQQIGATEFEILTAVAFEIFTREQVHVGIVECGMGGALDATNVLKSKSLTVISKVGLDHQEFLGSTVEEIAREKCGIFRAAVPVYFDQTNDPSVVDVIEQEATAIGALLKKSEALTTAGKQPWQLHNGTVALAAATYVLSALGKPARSIRALEESLWMTQIPGRLQTINLKPITGIDVPALMDGAHNVQGMAAISPLIDSKRNNDSNGVIFVIAASAGKNVRDLFLASRPLLRAEDTVAAVEFGPVAGMPWKAAMPSQDIVEQLTASIPIPETVGSRAEADTQGIHIRDFGPALSAALKWAAQTAETSGKPICILGSLYLVSDVLRLLRDAEESSVKDSKMSS
jgi:folylpolyglutamate synthase